MRLSHPMLSAPIRWREGRIPALVLEHPKIFRRAVFELSAQADGDEGEFVLSLDFGPLECAGRLHVLRDYVSLPLSDRNLQNKFQSLLQSVVREELQEKTEALQSDIASYLEAVTASVGCAASFSCGEYAVALLKALKYQPAIDEDGPLERLMQYIGLYCRLLKDQCFVLVGAHTYFSREELGGLFLAALNKRWNLLILERDIDAALPQEDVILLDGSLCELRLDLEDEMS